MAANNSELPEWLDWLEIAGNRWKQLEWMEMAGNDWNGWKLLKIAGNGGK